MLSRLCERIGGFLDTDCKSLMLNNLKKSRQRWKLFIPGEEDKKYILASDEFILKEGMLGKLFIKFGPGLVSDSGTKDKRIGNWRREFPYSTNAPRYHIFPDSSSHLKFYKFCVPFQYSNLPSSHHSVSSKNPILLALFKHLSSHSPKEIAF